MIQIVGVREDRVIPDHIDVSRTHSKPDAKPGVELMELAPEGRHKNQIPDRVVRNKEDARDLREVRSAGASVTSEEWSENGNGSAAEKMKGFSSEYRGRPAIVIALVLTPATLPTFTLPVFDHCAK